MDIKIASYNIRIDLESDGQHSWFFRKEPLTALLNRMDFDFIGIQETRRSQYDYLQKHSQYQLFGDYRSFPEDHNNEACPILFNSNRFTMEKGDTFWLSETPDAISKYKDADCLRIATWGLFKSRKEGQQLAFINTHLDHIGPQARVFGAKLLTSFIKENFQDIPVFLTGDFNENEHGQWYQILTENGMIDTREAAVTPHQGPYGTATGYAFEKEVPVNDYMHIDFIFANHVPAIKSAFTLSPQETLISDHLLIYIEADI